MGCDTTWTVHHDRGMTCKSDHCQSGRAAYRYLNGRRRLLQAEEKDEA